MYTINSLKDSDPPDPLIVALKLNERLLANVQNNPKTINLDQRKNAGSTVKS